jgi:hypothetical protein
MRRAGLMSGALVVWALAEAFAILAPGYGIALVALPFAIAAAVALAVDLRRPSSVASALAASFATLALAFAVAGHVLYWGGFHRRLFLLDAAPLAQAGAIALVLLLVPLYAGLRQRALERGWEASGSRARGLRSLLGAWGDPKWRGALARWAQGAALPGLLVLDAALATRRPDARMHADAPLDALADALPAHGVAIERKARELVVKLQDAPAVTVSASRVLLPPGPTLELRGPPAQARRLRRLLEGEASHALLFCWSAPARRWERRLNALHTEALDADTLEERSLVMEELDRVRRAVAERALCGEEFSILSIKEREARTLLAHRMLSEPPGNRGEPRVLAQHAALMPEVGRVLDAGGLGAVKRVAFVPHWIVPVETPWGEEEAVVSAATGKLDAAESRALLDAMRERGPVLFLDVGASAVFLPAPPPTGALLREMHNAGIVVAEGVATGEVPADVVYVPYLATAEGYASGVTGRIAPDLGNAVPVAPA